MCLLQNHQVQGTIKLLRLLAEKETPPDYGIKKGPLSDDDSDALGLQYRYWCICF